MYTLSIIPFESRTLSKEGKPLGGSRQSYGIRLYDENFDHIASDFTLMSELGSPGTWDEGLFLNELNESFVSAHIKSKRIRVMWYAHPHPWVTYVQSSGDGWTIEE